MPVGYNQAFYKTLEDLTLGSSLKILGNGWPHEIFLAFFHYSLVNTLLTCYLSGDVNVSLYTIEANMTIETRTTPYDIHTLIFAVAITKKVFNVLLDTGNYSGSEEVQKLIDIFNAEITKFDEAIDRDYHDHDDIISEEEI